MKPPVRFLLPAALALLMLATRADHFGSSLHLPDASLAVFFLAGFYLRGKWAFPLLLAEAGLIDYVAIAQFGVSDFCVSPAYAFLVPAYAAPWAAGVWLRGRAGGPAWASLPLVAAAWLAASCLAFLLSNGSFYWLSGRFAELGWDRYVEQAGLYFLPHLAGPSFYVALAAALHGLLHALPGAQAEAGREARG